MNKTILLSLVLMLVLSAAAAGETRLVPSEYPTIQDAIDDCNDGDEIIVSVGIYFENINFSGRNIVLRSTEPTDPNVVANTIIDGSLGGSVVTFSGTESANCVLSGFTIINGKGTITGNWNISNGGGIYGNGTKATIQYNVITKNQPAPRIWPCSTYGGGLHNCDGIIRNNIISENRTTCDEGSAKGGGLYGCDGAIQNNLILNNSASGFSGGGGFIEGGGLYDCDGTIRNNTIVGNSATGWRPHEYVRGGGLSRCNGSIKNCIIWDNVAFNGAQLYSSRKPTYSCIQTWTGGGEGNINADPCFIDAASDDYHLSPYSLCINAGDPCYSEAPGDTDIDGESRVINGRVDIGADEVNYEGPLITISPSGFEFLSYEDGCNPEPQIISVWNNGLGILNWQITEDCDWLDISPTSSQSSGELDEVAISVDARELDRGVEYNCALIVSDSNALNNPRTTNVSLYLYTTRYVPSQHLTIQDAIDAARDSEAILVADGTYTGEGNRNIDFKGKAITVRSENGPEDCIIDCNEMGRGFVFSSGEDSKSVLDGFTITGGNALLGGGIYCYRSSPTLTNCTIIGNTAEENGGGIYCESYSNPTLTNCKIMGNTAEQDGGGIYCYRGIDRWGYSNPMLTNSTVVANYAENNAGGLFSGSRSRPKLTNCIFWINEDDSGTGQLSQIKGGRPEVIYSCIQDDDANDTDIPFSDANGNIDDRPRFVRNPDDGGDGWGVGNNDDFGDVHLKVVSPCIDSGLPDFVAGANAVDMDGQPRVMGLRIDMGADEYEKIIVVTEPVGGEVWAAGSTHEIQWSSYGAGQVDILLSKNAGGSWQSIKNGISDTGGYSWHILNKYCSGQAQVKVVPSEPDANVICIESGVFAIVPYEGPVSVPRRKKEPRYRPVAKYGPEFGCVKWKFETDGPVTAGVTIGREIDKQRKVYAACEDGKLYALDLETGSLVWSYDVNSALVGSAAEGLHGSVYVGGRDGKLYAIDKEGQLLWTHSTDAPIYSSAVVSPQEQIYVCSEDGMLYALKRNGSEVWRYETSGFAKLDGSIFATLQITSDGTVYIAGLYDPNLYALNPKDGSVKWRCNFAPPHDPCAPSSGGRRSGWPFAPPAIAPDGTIYQTLLYDPNLYAVEPDTGTVIWSTDLAGTLMWYKKFDPHDPCPYCYYQALFIWYGSGDPPEYIDGHELYLIGRHRHAPSWTSPALGPDGTIYVSFDDPYLRAVDPDGNVKWATRLGMVGGLTVTVGDDGLVYAASTDNKLYVVEPTGEEVARFEGEGWLSHPTIAPGHTIIVSDANNTVWAITQEDCGDKPIVLDVPPEPNEP